MLGMVARGARTICRTIIDVGETVASRLARLWHAHLDRVGRDPGYAAATAALVAGTLGLMAAHDVLGVIVAGVLGVYVNGTRDAGGAMRAASRNYDMY